MTSLKIQINNIHCSQCESFIRTLLSHYFIFPSPIAAAATYGDGASAQTVDNQHEPRDVKLAKTFDDDASTFTLKPPSLKQNPAFKKVKATDFYVDYDSGIITINYSSQCGPLDDNALLFNVKTVLDEAGFEVEDAYYITDLESSSANHIGDDRMHFHRGSFFHWVEERFSGRRIRRQRYRIHLKHCEYCRKQDSIREPASQTVEEQEKSEDAQNTAYQAIITIEGMMGPICSQKVEHVIKEQLKENESVGMDLLNDVAKVIVCNKQSIHVIIESIRGLGYDAKLAEILPVIEESKFKVTAAIGGITCAACASTITNAVQNLPFVDDVAINVVSKIGIFIIDSANAEHVKDLEEIIEDSGYEFQKIGSIERVNHASAKRAYRTIHLRIDGMYCAHCPERVNEALRKFGSAEIVVDTAISLKHPFIKFRYIPNVERGITIRAIIDSIVTEASNNSDNNFKISIVEELTLEEHLKRLAQKSTREIIIRQIATTLFAIPTFIFGVVGMSLLKPNNVFRMWLEEPIWRGNVARVVWILFILSTPVYFFITDLFHRKALKEVRALWNQKNNWKRRLFKFGSMNLLMSLGTSVAYFASIALLAISGSQKPIKGHNATTTYFDSVVFLTFFLLIGRLLESISKSKTVAAISNLSAMKKQTSRLLDNYGKTNMTERVVDVKYLEAGDHIKISPGGSPPSDCVIIQGESEFDESALTGESVPVSHLPGDQIFAGTVNIGRSTIIAKLIALDGDSLLDQIVNTVRDGQLKRAPVEKLADALTGYFVPVIVLLAVSTWVIWLALGYGHELPQEYLDTDVGGWAVWSLEFAISVFVVACPCGIGLAAPTALFVGSGLAAKYGILAKGGGAAFQDGSQVSVVCFDKTGTLTKGGAPKVTDFAIHENPKIKLIAAQLTRDLESNSKHPLAIGVKNFIDEEFGDQLTTTKVPETEEVPGLGMMGEIIIDNEAAKNDVWRELKPERVILGNERFMRQNEVNLTTSQLKSLDEWKSQGKSVIIVALQCPTFFQGTNYFPVLLMGARDEVREEAKGVIEILQDEGIECWMISGDNEMTANAIANELGIDQVVAEVLPNEKGEKIKWIQQTYKKDGKPAIVAMVGDGINDAPAMAKADVGVALASGSDLAMISCDFILLSSSHSLKSLLILFQLSKKVFRRVKFNFAWALIYNMIAIPIAAGVIYPYKHARLSPVWASAAMALSSVSVVLSSLALRLFRPHNVALSNDVQLPQTAVEHRFR